jgi:hypothetical protein
MNHKLAFETAPYDQLCNCVTVELTPEQGRLMDAWPEKGQAIVKSAMLNGQQRHVDGECQCCNATGLIAEKAA